MAETSALTRKDRLEQNGSENTRGGVYFTPRVDIFETDQELTLVADVPGVGSEDVDLRFEKGELLLHARVKPRHENEEFMLREYEEGDFYRAFTIHESIDNAKIEAECKNGVLTIHLPKVEAVRPRQIKVRGQQGVLG